VKSSERGETLVELIVAIAILGIAFAAILGGLATGVFASSANRSQTDADIALRAWADAVRDSTYDMTDGCTPTGYSWASLNAATALPLPADLSPPASPTITAVSLTQAFSSWKSEVPPVTADCDNAYLQRIILTIQSKDTRASESVDVVMMKP